MNTADSTASVGRRRTGKGRTDAGVPHPVPRDPVPRGGRREAALISHPASGTSGGAAATARRWCDALQRGDVAAGCLAPEVQVVSPLTARFRLHSRDQAQVMLGAAFEVITDIRVPTLVGDGPRPSGARPSRTLWRGGGRTRDTGGASARPDLIEAGPCEVTATGGHRELRGSGR